VDQGESTVRRLANRQAQLIVSTYVPEGTLDHPPHYGEIQPFHFVWPLPVLLHSGRQQRAREARKGYTYHVSIPAPYQKWLGAACKFAAKESHPLVFINAWNEWSEGAYLEPDRRYGYAYLQATAKCFEGFAKSADPGLEIIFVSHDTANAGAQRLLISLIEWLRDVKGAFDPRLS
jgi:hypothetical protein